MKKILVIMAVTIGLTAVTNSCRVSITPQKSLAKYEQATSRDVKGIGVLQVPTIADLDIHPERMSEEFDEYIVSSEMRRLREQLTSNTYRLNDVAQKQYQLRVLENQMEAKAMSLVAEFQKIAKSKILIKYNADVLVDPRYSIEIINNEQIKITVSGYLAKYKNFRPIQAKDTALFKFEPVYSNPNFEMGGVIIRK